MTQTVTTVNSYSVTPVNPPGQITQTVDNAILVTGWSTPIAVTDDSTFTVVAGAGGQVRVQFSPDNANWLDAAAIPYSGTFSSGIPPGLLWIRAMGVGATGTLTTMVPVPWTALTSAQAAALNTSQRNKRFIEAWTMCGGLFSNWIANATIQTIYATRGPAYAFRMAYMNANVAGVTYDNTTIATSTQYNTGGNPTGSYVPVTWSGGAPVTLAGSAANTHVISPFSDWITLAPAIWTAAAGTAGAAYQLHYIRSFSTAGGGSYLNNTSIVSSPQNVNGGLVIEGGWQSTGNFTASGITATNKTQFSPIICEFRLAQRGVRIMTIGDSLTAGGNSGTSYGIGISAFGLEACNILNVNTATTGKSYSVYNTAWGGTIYSNFGARLATELAIITPDIVVIPCGSPNSAMISQAQQDTNTAQFLDLIYQAQTVGAIPVIWTMPPKNANSSTQDSFRLSMNQVARNIAATYGLPLVDIEQVTGGTGSAPVLWPTAYNLSDGLHPNELCTTVWAQAFANVIATVI